MAALSTSLSLSTSKSMGKSSLLLILPLLLVVVISISSLLNFDLTTCTRVSNLYWDPNHNYNIDRNAASIPQQQHQFQHISPTQFDLAVQFSYDLIDPTTKSSMVQIQQVLLPTQVDGN